MLKNLDFAYQSFFRKRSEYPSLSLGATDISPWRIHKIPFGTVKNPHSDAGSSPNQTKSVFVGTIKTVTLKKSPTHKYLVSNLVDDRNPPPQPIRDLTRVCGVNLGLSQLATVARATATKHYADVYQHVSRRLKTL